jgi:fission 1 protein
MTARRRTGTSQEEQSGSEPYAIDASMSLAPEELQVLQDQYVQEQDKGFISTQTKFNLAWCVVAHA